MNFSSKLWQDNLTIYNSIIELEFIKQMINGTLDLAKFQYYIIQDAHYLIAYSKALAIVASKAQSKDDIAFFANAAHDAIIVERSLHTDYMQKFAISQQDYVSSVVQPSCTAYTNFLLSTTAISDYAVGVSALLPCFWIYAQVGKYISQQNISADNPYIAWIKTYCDEGFQQITNEAIKAVDRAANNANSTQLQQMSHAFNLASRYEWLFWHAAYRQEQWLI